MVHQEASMSFEEYFGQHIELDGKTLLDAETVLGLTTPEIAKRIDQVKAMFNKHGGILRPRYIVHAA